jgi:hypothetical protein
MLFHLWSVYLISSIKTLEIRMLSFFVYIAQLEELSAHDLRQRYGYKLAEHIPQHQLAKIMGLDNIDSTIIYVKSTRSPFRKKRFTLAIRLHIPFEPEK